ncbi:MAG: hypothetical protein DRQ88_12425 [Epsilonproteobacteria bacterium]|nr:MAG: hypothetical protein DRQ88_12425 [Campylobacterota bacterium]
MKALPMKTQEVMEFFQNPDEIIEVDLENSSLQGEVFVTYITNMRMKTTLVGGTSQQKLDLLIPYLTSAYTTNCKPLLEGGIDLLLSYRGIEPLYNTWLPAKDLEDFAKNHKEDLDPISEFLDSLVCCIPSFNTKYKKSVFDKEIEQGNIEVITDASIIGPNILGLLQEPNFFEIFVSSGVTVKKYYKHQFEVMRFNNKGLFDIVSARDSLLMPILDLLSEPTEESIEILKKHSEALTP